MSKHLPGGRRGYNHRSVTCPLGLCKHPVLVHDIDETPGVRIERCTVADCECNGLVESRAAA